MAENLATAMAELRAKEAALEQREAERRRAERGRAAQLAVSRVIAESDAPEGAMRRLLEAIGASLRWDWGEAWRADDEAGLLRRLERWAAAPEAAKGDGDAPGGAIPRGAGLPGRVWATGEADWIEDVRDAQRGRGDAAHVAAGMRTACGFPVRAGRGVVAVMAFGSAEIRPPDDALLATMTGLGGQIGQFLERKEGEDVLRRTEEQLRGMQKMDAIGQLAGGVAHDFNNLLTVIIGRSAMLLGQLRSVDPVRRDIQLIHDTAERAANLTRQLLAFGRKQVMQPRPLNLNAVAEGLTPMLRRLIGENIQLVTQFDPGLGLMQADPSRIEQVIMSGYTDRAIVHHGVLDPDVAFLEKPFAAADLRRKVREVLDVGADAGASPAAPGRGAGLEAV
jgi:signal transduction histidine kinase